MKAVIFGEGRQALQFGSQKINLHTSDALIALYAGTPTPGSADLCFLTFIPLDTVITHLTTCQIPIIEGPVTRTGATGLLQYVYIMDPDGNLIELSNRL